MPRRLGQLPVEADVPVLATLLPHWSVLTTPVVVWNGVSKAAGTYTIDTSAAGVPAGARALIVAIAAQFAAAGNSYEMKCCPTGATDSAVAATSQVTGVYTRGSGIVPGDANGDFDVIVSGGTSNPSYLLIWGYLR